MPDERKAIVMANNKLRSCMWISQQDGKEGKSAAMPLR